MTNNPTATTQPTRLKAVILDWAGTAVDFGCLGPTAVFAEVFAKYGVPVSPAEARGPMGLMKRDHIQAMCAMDSVRAKWRTAHGREPIEADVDAMYRDTERMMTSVIADYAQPIPGLQEAVAAFRDRGLKIGSTTGYTRPMMEVLTKEAARLGYEPDAWVCSTDVPAGRPAPYMCYRNAILLERWPLNAMVKIGDTISDIQEGVNAGMLTIGLTESGNELGLSKQDLDRADPLDIDMKIKEIEERFLAAGADFLARTIADTPKIIDRINRGLSS